MSCIKKHLPLKFKHGEQSLTVAIYLHILNCGKKILWAIFVIIIMGPFISLFALITELMIQYIPSKPQLEFDPKVTDKKCPYLL